MSTEDAAIIVVESDDEEEKPPEHFAEVYSVPRVSFAVRRRGLRASLAMDLKTGYDFLDFASRQRALAILASVCPLFLMISPPCTMFSALQICFKNFEKMDPATYARRMAEAMVLLQFAVMIAKWQMEQGRFFAWEHPSTASSWKVDSVQSLMSQCFSVDFDMCCLGLVCPSSGDPIKKRTRLMSNYAGIVPVFSRFQCRCERPHREIQGSVCGMKLSEICQHYPAGFCESLADVVQQAVAP